MRNRTAILLKAYIFINGQAGPGIAPADRLAATPPSRQPQQPQHPRMLTKFDWPKDLPRITPLVACSLK